MNHLSTFLVLYGCGVLLSEATTNCNCKAGCDRDLITRCTACQDGWYGPYCQKRNVALGGTATQQGAYRDSIRYYTAELAVDGNTDTNFSNGSCSHTDDRYNAWWNVRLGENGVNQMKYMTIYNHKSPHNARRRNGMEILVDGVRCKKWPDDVTPPVVDHVTCNTTMTGSNLTIRVLGQFFSLCEVQVFVCSDFWFGEDCDKQCNCLHSDDVCDKVSGSCRRGCQLGLRGGDCQTECDDGQYGLNCLSQCGHCLNNAVCNKTGGRCPSGCSAGWENELCNEVSVSTSYSLSLLIMAVICTAVLVLIIIGAILLGLKKYGRIQCIKDPVKEGRQEIEIEEMNPTSTNNDYVTLDSGTMSENKDYETIQQNQYGNI